jgi:hypothetical protein
VPTKILLTQTGREKIASANHFETYQVLKVILESGLIESGLIEVRQFVQNNYVVKGFSKCEIFVHWTILTPPFPFVLRGDLTTWLLYGNHIRFSIINCKLPPLQRRNVCYRSPSTPRRRLIQSLGTPHISPFVGAAMAVVSAKEARRLHQGVLRSWINEFAR